LHKKEVQARISFFFFPFSLVIDRGAVSFAVKTLHYGMVFAIYLPKAVGLIYWNRFGSVTFPGDLLFFRRVA
jgi:hypothetical protein